MSKKLITFITIMSMFFLFGCETNNKEIIPESSNYTQEAENKTESITEKAVEEENGPINKNNKTVDISIDDVKGISELDAIQLCKDVFGVINEMTGFKMGYRPVDAVEYRGKRYYVIYATWLVNGKYWSYSSNYLVSANGDEIYDCAIGDDGSYYISRRLWQISDGKSYSDKFIEKNPYIINENNKTMDILIDDVEGISALEAAQLCKDTVGLVDETTGYNAKYRPIGAVEYRGKQYYVIYAAWYIDDSNWIYIGYHLVSANGDEIYDCAINDDVTYYMSRKLWSK